MPELKQSDAKIHCLNSICSCKKSSAPAFFWYKISRRKIMKKLIFEGALLYAGIAWIIYTLTW
jgi:hypothetical protein